MTVSMMASLLLLAADDGDEFIGFVLAFAAGVFSGGFVMVTAMKRDLALFGILGAVFCIISSLGTKMLFNAKPEKCAIIAIYVSIITTIVVLIMAQANKRAPIAKKLEEAKYMREQALKAAAKRSVKKK